MQNGGLMLKTAQGWIIQWQDGSLKNSLTQTLNQFRVKSSSITQFLCPPKLLLIVLHPSLIHLLKDGLEHPGIVTHQFGS